MAPRNTVLVTLDSLRADHCGYVEDGHATDSSVLGWELDLQAAQVLWPGQSEREDIERLKDIGVR